MSISRDGTKLAEISLHNAIRRRTRKAFGAPIPPHWFRDAGVTMLVRDAPASARLTSSILGHASPDIATRHSNQALMIDAAPPPRESERAFVYARCSSDLQREASIEDQIQVCRPYAEAQGWTFLHEFSDRAASGSTRFRPGYQDLLAAARRHEFDVVLAEARSSLARSGGRRRSFQDVDL